MSGSQKLTWSDIPWGTKVTPRVRWIQYRIYKASKTGEMEKVYSLQKQLVSSLAAKLLAVKQVASINRGKNTAGIDKQLYRTPEAKLALALKLKMDGKTSLIRRVRIPKLGKMEKRPLGIPTMEDRAKQALAKLALEPQWEALFEKNSYGFRPGRGALDAIEAIFSALHHKKRKWVYDADIRKCFDEIDHDALLRKLNTYPTMRRQVKRWLKAGVMSGYANQNKGEEVTPTLKGTPQGGVISPLLANIALHGLENHLKAYVSKIPGSPGGAGRGVAVKKKALSVIRYADDFVLIHANKEILEMCIEETSKWLTSIGLEISSEKSRLREGVQGFEFLGFQIIQVRKGEQLKVKIQPSKASQLRFMRKVRELLQRHKAASAYTLIAFLRPIILGWANYFKYCECKQVFHSLTHKIFLKLRAWVFRRSGKKGRIWTKKKYFPERNTYKFDGSTHKDNWILNGSRKGKSGKASTNFLPHLVWVKSRKHVKVLGDESPYSNSMYWLKKRSIYSPLSTRTRKLYEKQKGKCPICGRIFSEFDRETWEIDHIIPRHQKGEDHYRNLQLIHLDCHRAKTRAEIAIYQPWRSKDGN